MRKINIVIGLLLLTLIAACQSAESKEVLEYHNGYVENVSTKLEELQELNLELVFAETDEEIDELIDQVEPILKEISDYMDAQDPENAETKEYHQLRLESIHALVASMEIDIELYRGFINESLSDEEIEQMLEESNAKFEEFNDWAIQANEKIDELSERFNFEEINE